MANQTITTNMLKMTASRMTLIMKTLRILVRLPCSLRSLSLQHYNPVAQQVHPHLAVARRPVALHPVPLLQHPPNIPNRRKKDVYVYVYVYVYDVIQRHL